MKAEKHSIEFIPPRERYGRASQLFTIWFSANMQVTTMLVGALGIVSGLSFYWVVAGLIIGNFVGAIFMAAHSAQGPQLGIPQMIQSRAQFGVLGAAVPLIAIVLAYVLFFAANGVMMRDAVKDMLHVGNDTALAIFSLVTFVIAFFGYDLIHKLGKVMTWMSALLFAAVTVIVLTSGSVNLVAAPEATPFALPVFILVVMQSFSWSLGFGPFVADYSRYLPADVPQGATFWYSYLGQTLGASIVMIVGALAATAAINISDSPALAIAGLFGAYSSIALVVVLLGVVLFNVLCLYSGYMSTVTIFSGFKGMGMIPWTTKLVVMAAIAAAGTFIGVATQDNFFAFFGDILIGQAYVLVPWSAINLVDYYYIRRGEYKTADIFDKDGIYGRYNMSTIAIFVVSILAQLPFMSLSIYQGPVAALIGADIACVVGLVVPIILYATLFQGVREARAA
ncbi:cytosine permease [Ensifer sp. NBAIM29]|nr:cytosine permease [Ensifer sp. NBAIM29]